MLLTNMDTKALAPEIVEGMRLGLLALPGTTAVVRSVCVCGSYVRGDFIDRNSDLDLLIVLSPHRADTGGVPENEAVRDVQAMATRFLASRVLYSHNPRQFDWLVAPWEAIPKRTEDHRIPDGRPGIALLGVFAFDLLDYLNVLWGDDPRTAMATPPPLNRLARGWFDSIGAARDRYGRASQPWRIAFSAFKSAQVAQIVFGEQTLDKRRLPELYRQYVPDFPLKAFGQRMITDKLEARYPDRPCQFATWDEYASFEDELAALAKAHL
jgi:hypothetical protein